jgi:hypothetical protein
MAWIISVSGIGVNYCEFIEFMQDEEEYEI